MASTTPNIGLTLPTGTEGWKRSVINGNFTILDTKIGAVGNTPLQTQINTLNSQIGDIDWATNGTNIPANSDINNYKTPGKYYSSSTSATSTMSNAPVTGGFSLFVVILGYDWINQYAMPVNGQTIKHRVYTASSNTWSAWQTLTFA